MWNNIKRLTKMKNNQIWRIASINEKYKWKEKSWGVNADGKRLNKRKLQRRILRASQRGVIDGKTKDEAAGLEFCGRVCGVNVGVRWLMTRATMRRKEWCLEGPRGNNMVANTWGRWMTDGKRFGGEKSPNSEDERIDELRYKGHKRRKGVCLERPRRINTIVIT